MKKWLSILLVFTLCLALTPSALAENALTSASDCQCEGSLISAEAIQRMEAKLAQQPRTVSDANLPDSVDNSTSMYFPVIGDQKNYGSCAAWAVAYYTYTYEVNRLHNTPAKVQNSDGTYSNIAANVYSPAWPFSYMSESSGIGTCIDWVLDFAENHGLLNMVDMPYYDATHPYPYLPTDDQMLLNALSTRVVDWDDGVFIDTREESITSPDSELLTEVKELLADGYVLATSSNWAFDVKENSFNEKSVYRFRDEKAHAVTVVGYDDTIWCDINENEEDEPAEYGAFKIANSHGTTANGSNAGYYWIPYDALNWVSAVPGDWEDSLSGTRKPALALNWGKSWFLYCDVADYDVTYACLTDLTISNPDLLEIELERTSLTSPSDTASKVHKEHGNPDKATFSCTMAYDYSAMATPLRGYVSGYRWSVTNHAPNAVQVTSLALVDNLNQDIDTYTCQTANQAWYCDIDLPLGDVDYDGTLTTEDLDWIYDKAGGGSADTISHLQFGLTDQNEDGEIDMTDAYYFYRQLANRIAVGSPEYAQLQAIMNKWQSHAIM